MALLAGGFLPDQQGTAIAIIRAANIGLGALTLVAIAWFGAQIGGRHRVPVAIGMAAIAGSAFPMIRFGAEIYNDMLVALAAALALALALATRIILTGRITWVTGIGLALVSVVGLGTKATFVIPLAVVVGGLVLAALVRRVAGERRAPLRIAFVALGALVAAVAANAWFYLINLERSGSLHRSSPKAPVGGRAHRSTADVLGDLDFWAVVGRGFIGRAEPDHERFTAMSALVVGAMLVAGLAALV
ncbi:MAG: hypothetical protein GXX90_05020, partial [Microbacteriaceae bacterium]|nr:hypothetical protein [Microbacteriaceae bacterium]